MKRSLPLAACVALAAAFGLSACSPFGALVGVGATVGTAAVDERGVSGTATDVRIRTEINAAWVKRDAFGFAGVGLLIHEGQVVLTGTVADAALHADAVSLARGVSGVTEVYDHIRVDPGSGLGDYTEDSGIVGSMRKGIMLDKSITSLNYDIDASNHVLYLIGIAQDAGEKQRVLAHARAISGVRQVVEYIRVKTP
ncbi:MAG: BON domain-containing protein [Rhodospirillaceae bacterium]